LTSTYITLYKTFFPSRSEADKQRLFKKCTTLLMVIRFARNKNNQKVVEEQAV